MTEASIHFRSEGERGATPQILRGQGADFEGAAKVFRGDELANVYSLVRCCVLCKRSKEDYKYVLIKGTSCFVFSNENAPSPKYAIPLERLHTERTKGSSDDVDTTSSLPSTVRLIRALGDVEYEFEFKNPDAASRFCRAVSKEVKVAADVSAKKRLGHLVDSAGRSNSVAYANKIAEAKKKDQPDNPSTVTELNDTYMLMNTPGGIGAI